MTNAEANNRILPWFSPDMPTAEDCVLPHVLRLGSQEHGDRILAVFENGDSWTWSQAWLQTRQWANGLRSLGVKEGDHVLVWLPNGPEFLASWFALNALGATMVPLNLAYRGDILGHAINLCGAQVVIGHSTLLERLAELETPVLRTIIVASGPSLNLPSKEIHGLEGMRGEALEDIELPCVKPWQATSIILTSGTTGVSKGVICSYFQLYLSSTALLGHLQSGDRCYSYMPFFHIGGLGAVYAAIVRRAAVAVVESFKTERFWSDIRRMECNACCGIFNSVVQFLSKRPMKDDERSLLTRPVPMAPVDAAAITLAKNYGFDYYTGFGMSEAPMPLASPMNPVAGKGYCGHPRQGLTCRVVDGNDIECPPGTTGELVLRSNLPWDLTVGYLHNDAATAAAFRNGWFHTGDAFRRESDGSFYFVDRLKDSIRRRGENISSQEVEFAVIGHPDVLDAAAYAVPSDNAEDEVMVAIEAKPGRQIDFAGLTEHLRDRLPHFMVPRFLRVVQSLPRTQTGKVQKATLRMEGRVPGAWDREAHGIRIKRQDL